MAIARLCPHCRQPIAYERCGAFLTPLKAEIFDAIKRAGELGISGYELAFDVYRDRPRRPALTTIKAHIWQINDLLEATDRIIRYDASTRRWHLARRRLRRVA